MKQITSYQYLTPATQPKNSRLSLKNLASMLTEPLASWDCELARVMEERTLRAGLN